MEKIGVIGDSILFGNYLLDTIDALGQKNEISDDVYMKTLRVINVLIRDVPSIPEPRVVSQYDRVHLVWDRRFYSIIIEIVDNSTPKFYKIIPATGVETWQEDIVTSGLSDIAIELLYEAYPSRKNT
jgi:hypothetical protein